MPSYDYLCLDCHRRFEVRLSYSAYGAAQINCAHCGSANVRRRPPRVRLLRGEEAALESLADPSKLDGLEDDPRGMAKMFRQMGSALGEGLPSEFNEVVDRLDAGQSPAEIESALPGLGGEESAAPSAED